MEPVCTRPQLPCGITPCAVSLTEKTPHCLDPDVHRCLGLSSCFLDAPGFLFYTSAVTRAESPFCGGCAACAQTCFSACRRPSSGTVCRKGHLCSSARGLLSVCGGLRLLFGVFSPCTKMCGEEWHWLVLARVTEEWSACHGVAVSLALEENRVVFSSSWCPWPPVEPGQGCGALSSWAPLFYFTEKAHTYQQLATVVWQISADTKADLGLHVASSSSSFRNGMGPRSSENKQ